MTNREKTTPNPPNLFDRIAFQLCYNSGLQILNHGAPPFQSPVSARVNTIDLMIFLWVGPAWLAAQKRQLKSHHNYRTPWLSSACKPSNNCPWRGCKAQSAKTFSCKRVICSDIKTHPTCGTTRARSSREACTRQHAPIPPFPSKPCTTTAVAESAERTYFTKLQESEAQAENSKTHAPAEGKGWGHKSWSPYCSTPCTQRLFSSVFYGWPKNPCDQIWRAFF